MVIKLKQTDRKINQDWINWGTKLAPKNKEKEAGNKILPAVPHTHFVFQEGSQ